MLSPLPRRSHWRYCVAHSSSGISLPRYGSRVGPRIVLFEACSAFTRVTACTLALSPYFVTRFTRRLQPFRHLHDCSGCFRLELSPGGIRTHWKSAALSRRTPGADIERARRERSFISMQTTGPAFVPQPRRERTAFVAVAPTWHRLGPILTLAGCTEDDHENDSQRAPQCRCIASSSTC
jgi:hypothetical protein